MQYGEAFTIPVGGMVALPDFLLERLADVPARDVLVAGRPLALGGGAAFRACSPDGLCVETATDNGFGDISPGRFTLGARAYIVDVSNVGGQFGYVVKDVSGA